jgi:spore maturation protein CgeB
MSKCQYLFNHGQKHDGPNQRVMESMAMRRPLITDRDERSGMDKLFIEGVHYTGYEAYTYKGLEDAMWAVRQDSAVYEMADLACYQVKQHHQVSNRVDQMLEVLNAY